MGRKITIEPVTRVEGHGKVTIHLDDDNNVAQTRLHIVEFRGFERFVQGRPYWEMPVLSCFSPPGSRQSTRCDRRSRNRRWTYTNR